MLCWTESILVGLGWEMVEAGMSTVIVEMVEELRLGVFLEELWGQGWMRMILC